MFKFLVLATLIIAASSTETGFESVFAQFPDNQFAQAINSMIQMSVGQNQSRLQEISDMLHEIQAMLDRDQVNADAAMEKNRLDCEGELANLAKKVEDLKKQLADSEGEQSDLAAELTDKQSKLKQEQMNQESTNNDLAQARQDQENEASSWETYRVSFEEAISACEEAIRLMKQLANGVATSFIQNNKNSGMLFVQLSQKFNDVKKVLENHVKSGGPAAFVQPVIDILSELSNQQSVDVGKVEQIVELIQTLLVRLREGLETRRQENVKTQGDLDTLIETLTESLKNSGTQIDILTTRIAEIQARQTKLQSVVTNQGDLLAVNENLLAQTDADCKDAETQYTNQTATRTANLAVLDALIAHFDSQVAPTVGNVSQQV